MGDAGENWSRWRMSALDNYTLGPICKKGSNPLENRALDAIMTEFPQHVFVRHGVEGFREIEYC